MQGAEDKDIVRHAQGEVKTTQDEVTDEILAAAMINNPLNDLKQAIILNLSCNNLVNMDKKSKTDAFCIVWDITKSDDKKKVGRTELIADNLNPQFVTAINVDYFFEQSQTFRVDVYDADHVDNLDDASGHELVGSYQFLLSDVCCSINQELEGPLTNPAISTPGNIHIRATERKSNYGKTLAKFEVGLHLTAIPKDGVFFTLNRARDNMGDEVYVPVHKSSVSKLAGGKANWAKVLIDTDTLYDNNEDQNILV